MKGATGVATASAGMLLTVHVYKINNMQDCEFRFLLMNKIQDMIRKVNASFIIFKTIQYSKSWFLMDVPVIHDAWTIMRESFYLPTFWKLKKTYSNLIILPYLLCTECMVDVIPNHYKSSNPPFNSITFSIQLNYCATNLCHIKIQWSLKSWHNSTITHIALGSMGFLPDT